MKKERKSLKIFQPNTSLTAKILCVLFVLLLASTLISLFVQVLIDDAIIDKLYWVAGVISIVSVVIMVLGLFRPTSRIAQRLQAQGMGKVKGVLSILLGIPLISFMGVCHGLPVMLHMLLPTEERALVITVDHKNSHYHSKGCSGGVFAKEFDGFLDQICGMQRDDWQRIDEGQKIMLLGQRSAVGFSYDSYRMPKQ